MTDDRKMTKPSITEATTVTERRPDSPFWRAVSTVRIDKDRSIEGRALGRNETEAAASAKRILKAEIDRIYK